MQCYTCPSLHQEVILSFWDLRDTLRAADPTVLHYQHVSIPRYRKVPDFLLCPTQRCAMIQILVS